MDPPAEPAPNLLDDERRRLKVSSAQVWSLRLSRQLRRTRQYSHRPDQNARAVAHWDENVERAESVGDEVRQRPPEDGTCIEDGEEVKSDVPGDSLSFGKFCGRERQSR